MYKVGDVVKVIPESYIDLAKGFLNSPNTWKTCNPKIDTHLMLGGVYKLLSVESSNQGDWYSLISEGVNNLGKLRAEFLTLDSSVKRCPFNVGDKVIFDPKCLEEDRNFLISILDKTYGISSTNRTREVTYVLNDYYIFVDFPKDHPNAYPFRWMDFKEN